MATKEGKPKRWLFKSFYKSSSNKNQKPKSIPEPKPEPELERDVFVTKDWNKPAAGLLDNNLLLRKLEGFQIDEKGGGGDCGRRDLELRRGGGGGGGGNAVEGRRSVSQVEANVASSVAFLQVKVLVTDMPGYMQVHAFRSARRTYDSLEKFSSKHIAYNMKKVMYIIIINFQN